MRRVCVLLVVVACGQSRPDDQPDAAAVTPDGNVGGGAADAAADAGSTDSASVACFYDWATLGNCPAPEIDAAYLTTDCGGGTGVFVVGHGFESANQFMTGNGWLPYGPRTMSTSWNANVWDELTPTFMCVTTSADPLVWSGFALQVKNPDGQVSSSVTVQDLLDARPPLVSSGSDDPFDPDACLDPELTSQQALATFPMGAGESTIARFTIMQRTRSCNAATGCLDWNRPSMVAPNVPVGMAITGGGSTIDATLGGVDCGALGSIDMTIQRNDCYMPNNMYSVHVAEHCLRVWATNRTSIQGDGSYTETDFGAIARY